MKLTTTELVLMNNALNEHLCYLRDLKADNELGGEIDAYAVKALTNQIEAYEALLQKITK